MTSTTAEHAATAAAAPEPESFDTGGRGIGGGPAGTTAATLLARKGWQVTLLEKAAHPRILIGDSPLPMKLPNLERLAVRDQLHATGRFKPGNEDVDTLQQGHP